MGDLEWLYEVLVDTPQPEGVRILGLTIACRTCPSMVLLSDT